MTGRTDVKKLSGLLRICADMIDSGYCDNLDGEVFDNIGEVVKPMLNVKVDFEQSKKITGKTDKALASKLSRVFIPKFKKPLYNYLDILKIKNKEI